MKMEVVQKHLSEWGELIVTTASGEKFELHLGDTKFDKDQRVIVLTTPEAEYYIDGDSVEIIKKHYGHRTD